MGTCDQQAPIDTISGYDGSLFSEQPQFELFEQSEPVVRSLSDSFDDANKENEGMQSADSDLVALLFPVGVDDEKSLDEHFRTVIPPEELQRSGFMPTPVNAEKISESRVLTISSLSAKAPSLDDVSDEKYMISDEKYMMYAQQLDEDAVSPLMYRQQLEEDAALNARWLEQQLTADQTYHLKQQLKFQAVQLELQLQRDRDLAALRC